VTWIQILVLTDLRMILQQLIFYKRSEIKLDSQDDDAVLLPGRV